MLMQVSDKPFSSRAQSTHGNSHPGHHALSYATRKSLFSEDRFDELWRSIGQVSNMFALKPKCDHRRQVKISLWVAQRRTHWPLGELCVNQHVHLVTFQKKSHFTLHQTGWPSTIWSGGSCCCKHLHTHMPNTLGVLAQSQLFDSNVTCLFSNLTKASSLPKKGQSQFFLLMWIRFVQQQGNRAQRQQIGKQQNCISKSMFLWHGKFTFLTTCSQFKCHGRPMQKSLANVIALCIFELKIRPTIVGMLSLRPSALHVNFWSLFVCVSSPWASTPMLTAASVDVSRTLKASTKQLSHCKHHHWSPKSDHHWTPVDNVKDVGFGINVGQRLQLQCMSSHVATCSA